LGPEEVVGGRAMLDVVAIYQVESLEKAQAWWNSPATKDAFALGKKYATFRQFAVEGVMP
jgi:hypothetical protein